VAVNQAPERGQCSVRLPFTDLAGRSWRLRDLIGSAVYEREGDDLQAARAVPGRAGGAGLRLLPGAHAVINRPLFR
jgi:hypothetical protein